MANVAAKLAPIEALDPKGRTVALGTLWKDRPAVLVFIRHFG
jgi:hypothetical protein